jgi:ATP-dependent Clp protease adaptor protein ClpS
MSQAVWDDVLVTTRKPSANRPRPQPLPQYAVVVLNDNDHTFRFVIETLCMVCGCSKPQADQHAMEIHLRGRAAVWRGSREVAELKRDQIRSRGVDFYGPNPVHYPLGVVLEQLS